MHLKFGDFILYTPIYRLTERKKAFHVKNCPCGLEGVELGYVLRLLMHGRVVVEFGRKVFLVDCVLRKTLTMAKISITGRAQMFSCTRNSLFKETTA